MNFSSRFPAAGAAERAGSCFSLARPTAAPVRAPQATTPATTAVRARRRRRGIRGGGGVSSTEASTETSSKRSITDGSYPRGQAATRQLSPWPVRVTRRSAALPPVARRTTLGITTRSAAASAYGRGT